MEKIIVLKTDGSRGLVEVENLSLETMKGIVGGYIETLPLIEVEDALFVLNEEGKLEGLEPNFMYHGETVVGNVFICRQKGEEMVGLTDAQVYRIMPIVM
jgi:hypothetical protein